MDTLIISGGNIGIDLALDLLKANRFNHIIGVDGGLQFCYDHNIVPTRIVGDFDTLSHEILGWYKEHTKIEIREYNPMKAATDTQIAVELALSLGSDHITILGGTGTRLDHVLGNIQSLYLALEKGVECELVDEHNRIRLIRDEYRIRKAEQYGTYVSLIPFTTDVDGVTLEGLRYPLKDQHFTVKGSGGFGVSNEITADEARISLRQGIFIMIESKD